MWSFFVTFLAILICPLVVSGISISSWVHALGAALVLSLLNITAKPVLVFLTFPITFLTLGLFLVVINALLLRATSAIVKGFTVRDWWAALWGSLFISVVRMIADWLF